MILPIIAGALGALLRYLLSTFIHDRLSISFPFGTLAANLGGALALGFLAGATGLNSPSSVVLAAFLGGFTTFSTWILESIFLTPTRTKVLYMVLSLAGGIGLGAAGFSMAT
ncbi:MAG TPA: CrcB family protein [Acidimicrobiia bacterium]|nr:CrcB family protein [Acidimicrobiia bacterium]